MKVLIVDDNTAILEIVSEMLSSEGYETRTASSGKDALAKTRSYVPDLMLLDINLPDMDGWTVLRTLKEEGLTENLKVIMFTAAVDIGCDIFGLQGAVSGYVRKPFRGNELLDKVRQALDGDKGRKTRLRGLLSRRDGTSLFDLDRSRNGGRHQLLKEKEPRAIFDAAASHVSRGSSVLIITSEGPGEIRTRWGLEEIPIIQFSNQGGKATVDPSNLEMLAGIVSQFIEQSEGPVVVMEGLQTLIANNELEEVLGMMKGLSAMLATQPALLLVSVNPDLLDPEPLSRLEQCMELVREKADSRTEAKQ